MSDVAHAPAHGTQLLRCPRCNGRADRVTATTLGAFAPDADAAAEAHRFCPDPDCDVVYFGVLTGTVITQDGVTVPVGQKSHEDSRVLCYCFDYTAAALFDEIDKTCKSTVPDDIDARCRRLEHDCERKNPSGVCCLNEVRKLSVERLAAVFATGCCADGC